MSKQPTSKPWWKNWKVWAGIIAAALIISPFLPNEPQQTAQPEPTPSTTEAAPDTTPAIGDEVVNDFAAKYEAISGAPITDIEQGNIRTKFFGNADGTRFEMLHANDTDRICVTITAGREESATAFANTAKAINPALTDEEIETAWAALETESAVELRNIKTSHGGSIGRVHDWSWSKLCERG